MADKVKRLSINVEGNFFVDSTCINCDTCRQLAPETFEDSGEYSYVFDQPITDESVRKATRALLACPTGSIGTMQPNQAKDVTQDFPLHLDENVYYCGFNSPKSYGGNSYFIQDDGGNWMIDSPKFLPQLVKRFEEMGGIKHIFLTHRDDVAEASKYAAHFGSNRIIHRAELSAQPDAELIIEGTESQDIFPDFLVIPTPGHTRGHCVLLYKNKYLFTGDHMWWSRRHKRLAASERVCWYSWPEQIESTARLQEYDFQWVLPGHGQRSKNAADVMRAKLNELLNWMQTTPGQANEDLDEW
jgi:glyoxylase-like metal-dependent hydrolase (beta-lactamase superfamily II)/ferredoxin